MNAVTRMASRACRVLLGLAGFGCEPAPPPADVAPPPAVATTPSVSASTPVRSAIGISIGFRSQRQLEEHVEKHGSEFGTESADAYLQLAQALRDTVPGATILEVRRADGVVTRFDRTSGAFLAFNPDGTIRTFFKPNDGEQYFRRQARRRPGP